MSDLMLIAGKEIENYIQRLSQMARAAGIHIIMATQRPSVDVITGTIKANFPTRISFQVSSKIDSRTILGEQGAEQLLGKGDMLFMSSANRIVRIHGPYVSETEIENYIQRLSQMARAAGIHIIMATQRPSVDVITGTIKANFPTRISFQVSSKIDSRTILGEQGAEQLLGKGDMLFMSSANKIVRIHGPYVSESEIEKINGFLRSQAEPNYIDEITIVKDFENKNEQNEDDKDDLYRKAVDIIKAEGKASTSFLQRKLQIGYNRAARIIETMEKEGIVSQANHVGKREIL